MDSKELKERCTRITRVFDTLDHKYPISEFTAVITGFSEMDLDDVDIMVPFSDTRDVAFALGFVVGHSFEIADPQVHEDVEAIKKVIRETALLPSLPRDKSAP